MVDFLFETFSKFKASACDRQKALKISEKQSVMSPNFLVLRIQNLL